MIIEKAPLLGGNPARVGVQPLSRETLELRIAVDNTLNVLNIRQRPRRKKYYRKEHVVFQKSRRNLAITLDPAIVERYNLISGLDAAVFSIEDGKVTVSFYRREGALI